MAFFEGFKAFRFYRQKKEKRKKEVPASPRFAEGIREESWKERKRAPVKIDDLRIDLHIRQTKRTVQGKVFD